MNPLHKTLFVLSLSAMPFLAIAAGDHGPAGATRPHEAAADGHGMNAMHDDMHASAAGRAGNPAKVSRTIAVEMNDSMRFTPAMSSVKAGETVRFFIVNKGRLAHEMVIGTSEEIEEHAQMMRQMPNMVHQEANQLRLEPGKRGGIVWQFGKAGTVSYACLVPGHKEAGMVGTFEVK